MKVDLLLGSYLGLWAFQNTASDTINLVVTRDADIAEAAQALDIPVYDHIDATMPLAKVGLSVHYPRIVKPDVIAKYDKLYNLHPGYLPWGKGFYPVFWALWEDTPAGATLHEITAGLDEGPIVGQIEASYDNRDTGFTLYQKVRAAEKDLFLKFWPQIQARDFPEAKAQTASGTYHALKEFMQLKQNTNISALTADQFLKLIRCFSYENYTGLEVSINGQRFELRMKPLSDPA